MKKQKKAILNSTARLNILHGSVRSGKTVAMNSRWIEYCKYGVKGNLVIVGKTERTIKRNVIEPIAEWLGSDFHYGMGEVLIGNRKCDVVGANDVRAEEKIRGATLAGALCDEISLYPESFFDMLITRLSVPGAMLFGTSNPDSPYHWLKTNYLDNPERNLYQLKFSLDDNSYLDPAYVQELKTSFSGLFYKRFILGEWVLAEGLIYDMFDNVAKENEQYQYNIIAIDYGLANPTVFLKISFDNQFRVVVNKEYYHEYKNKVKTDSDLADDLVKFCEGEKILGVFVDPSAVSFINELKKRRFRVKPVDNDVLNGIAFVSQMFQNGYLWVYRQCKNLLREISLYSWDPKAQLKGEDKPLKVNDHACDALRYGIYSFFKSFSILPTIVSAKVRRTAKYANF